MNPITHLRPPPITPRLAAQRAFCLALQSKRYWDEHDAAHYSDTHRKTILRWISGQTPVDMYAVLEMPQEFQRVFWSALGERVPAVQALKQAA